jgi:hypothetical protein
MCPTNNLGTKSKMAATACKVRRWAPSFYQDQKYKRCMFARVRTAQERRLARTPAVWQFADEATVRHASQRLRRSSMARSSETGHHSSCMCACAILPGPKTHAWLNVTPRVYLLGGVVWVSHQQRKAALEVGAHAPKPQITIASCTPPTRGVFHPAFLDLSGRFWICEILNPWLTVLVWQAEVREKGRKGKRLRERSRLK